MNLIQEIFFTGDRNAEKLGVCKDRLAAVESDYSFEAGGIRREVGTSDLAVAGTTAGLVGGSWDPRGANLLSERPSQEREH